MVNKDDEDTLFFAQELRRSLKDGGIIPLRFSDLSGHPGYRVNGKLSLNVGDIPMETYASCSMSVTPKWRSQNPATRCFSAWSLALQRSETARDWHFNQDGTLCYVLHKEWGEFLSCPEVKDSAEEIEITAYFCLRNLRYLLVRQLVGYRNGLKTWPPEWAQWSHGIQGLNEYHRETREKRSIFQRTKHEVVCSMISDSEESKTQIDLWYLCWNLTIFACSATLASRPGCC